MKVGDIVLCVWQPGCSHVDKKTQCAMPMKYTIEGELGVIVKQYKHYNVVSFPQFVYEHHLSDSALEVISESR